MKYRTMTSEKEAVERELSAILGWTIRAEEDLWNYVGRSEE